MPAFFVRRFALVSLLAIGCSEQHRLQGGQENTSVASTEANVPTTRNDWPQILGPGRNGVAGDEKLADSWPKSGPRTVWQREGGSGFSGLAVAEGIAVLFHRVGDVEIVEAMNAATGQPIWKTDFPARYIPSYVNDNGPRAVPVIQGGRVYVFGALGGLRCVDFETGNKLWERDTFEEYNSKKQFHGEPPEGYFGIGSTPIVEGDKLIVNVGGDTKGAGIVAFSLQTGKTLWKATKERASYSSPVAATVDGVRHVIFVTRLNVVSIDPANGKVRFRFPFGAHGPKVSAATPLVLDGHLFVSASYEFGAVFAKIGPSDAKVLWSSDEMMSSQYTTCVWDNGSLYGIHGRQDRGRAGLRCFDPKTQKVCWEKSSFGYATLIKADGKLLILKTNGELVLAELNPNQYRELARATIFEPTIRERYPVKALPALATGRLYVRDTRTIKCINLRKEE